jgi:hypothetical protein
MTQDPKTIPLSQAEAEVALAVERVALLHLAYAEMLADEFGEARGRELAVKAIRRYGLKIGGKARKAALSQDLPLEPENVAAGGPNWPSVGSAEGVEVCEVEGEQHTCIRGCGLAKTWRAQGGEALGRLYCLVDAAKMMAYNPAYAVVHLRAEPDGDDRCELVLRETTAQERKDFAQDRDWSYMDLQQG